MIEHIPEKLNYNYKFEKKSVKAQPVKHGLRDIVLRTDSLPSSVYDLTELKMSKHWNCLNANRNCSRAFMSKACRHFMIIMHQPTMEAVFSYRNTFRLPRYKIYQTGMNILAMPRYWILPNASQPSCTILYNPDDPRENGLEYIYDMTTQFHLRSPVCFSICSTYQ